jgi:hypothetical protein
MTSLLGYWDDPATTAKEFVVDKPSGDRWFKVRTASCSFVLPSLF